MAPEMSVRQFKYLTFTQIDSRLFLAEFIPELRVTLDIAREFVVNRLEFTQGIEHFLIIDLSNIKEVTAEAKEYLQHPEGGLQKIKAAAFYTNNPIAALIASVYVKTPKPFESKLFDSKEKAYQWIREHMAGYTGN